MKKQPMAATLCPDDDCRRTRRALEREQLMRERAQAAAEESASAARVAAAGAAAVSRMADAELTELRAKLAKVREWNEAGQCFVDLLAILDRRSR